jgi:hypothetical protein
MPNSPNTSGESTNAAIDNSLHSVEAQLAKAVDVIKQQIAFYNQLLLLSGATITLTFTATASFHSHGGKGIVAIGFLIFVWILLVYAMLACLAANWCTIACLTHRTIVTSGVMTAAHQTRLKIAARNHAPEADLPSHETAVEVAKQSEVQMKGANKLERISGLLGLSAQLAVAIAYVLLLWFMSQNIRDL